ncbi:hypothetical protein AGMMS49573_01590 [Endomicrobiia bacterium]|nr:hypothetical protein AGMMS49573_01590 [Endomicrobiia bacterium]
MDSVGSVDFGLDVLDMLEVYPESVELVGVLEFQCLEIGIGFAGFGL